MRVLYVIPDVGIPLDGSKGAAVHVRAFSSALAAAGHDVFFASARPGALADHPQVFPLRVRRDERGRSLPGDLRARAAQAAVADDAVEIAKWCAAEVVVERLSLFPGAGAHVAAALGATHVMEVNAPLADEAATHRGLEAADEAREMERSAIQASGGVVVVSRELARWVARLRGSGDRVLHLPNGVEVSRFMVGHGARAWARDQMSASPSDVVVTFVGTLKPWHGVDRLVAAFSSAAAVEPRLRLLWVGDGPERAGLAEALGDLCASGRVHFAGKVPPSEVARWLAGSDVGVAPYPPHDGFYFSPLKVGEYAAAGLAVVMSDLPDLVDLLPDSTQAIRVPAGDVDSLARALIRVSRDASLRHQLGNAALRRAREALDWSARVADFERFVAGLPAGVLAADREGPAGAGPSGRSNGAGSASPRDVAEVGEAPGSARSPG